MVLLINDDFYSFFYSYVGKKLHHIAAWVGLLIEVLPSFLSFFLSSLTPRSCLRSSRKISHLRFEVELFRHFSLTYCSSDCTKQIYLNGIVLCGCLHLEDFSLLINGCLVLLSIGLYLTESFPGMSLQRLNCIIQHINR